MVETIEVGICPKCGVLTATEKLEKMTTDPNPAWSEDSFKCSSCGEISSRYQWDFKDFLVD